MSRFEFSHWHPLIRLADLGSRPKRVTLLGEPLVVFRQNARKSSHSKIEEEAYAVLHDTCPHRRARLSEGRVEDGRIVCPYHGFRFDAAGCGESPGTPRMRLECESFETRVTHGVVWVRRRGAETAFPHLDRDGFRFVSVSATEIEAPLETVVDNFCEVEHTPTTHDLFGYEHGSLGEVSCETTLTTDEVTVVNEGPQKRLPRLLELAFGVETGDTFVDAWTVRFSPVHLVYDQSWRAKGTGEPRREKIHLVVFLVPVDSDETRLFGFLFTNRPHSIIDPLLNPTLERIVRREIHCDKRALEKLSDPSPDLRGTRLGRFDAPLREHRKRIARIYRGE